jgi:5-methyltetrahydrofolate--homocysteine methyltransferase
MVELSSISEAVIRSRPTRVSSLVRQAISEGVAPQRIVDEALIPAMATAGEMFDAREIFVPELYMAADAMTAGLDILEPLLVGSEVDKGLGRVVIGTVEGDLHNIGKNLVGLMFEGAGYDVIDLGVDVSSLRFVEAVRQECPQILGMSSLLTTTMPRMEETLDALRAADLRDSVRVIVGGAPVTERFAARIGADGYGKNCYAAVATVKQLLQS